MSESAAEPSPGERSLFSIHEERLRARGHDAIKFVTYIRRTFGISTRRDDPFTPEKLAGCYATFCEEARAQRLCGPPVDGNVHTAKQALVGIRLRHTRRHFVVVACAPDGRGFFNVRLLLVGTEGLRIPDGPWDSLVEQPLDLVMRTHQIVLNHPPAFLDRPPAEHKTRKQKKAKAPKPKLYEAETETDCSDSDPVRRRGKRVQPQEGDAGPDEPHAHERRARTGESATEARAELDEAMVGLGVAAIPDIVRDMGGKEALMQTIKAMQAMIREMAPEVQVQRVCQPLAKIRASADAFGRVNGTGIALTFFLPKLVDDIIAREEPAPPSAYKPKRLHWGERAREIKRAVQTGATGSVRNYYPIFDRDPEKAYYILRLDHGSERFDFFQRAFECGNNDDIYILASVSQVRKLSVETMGTLGLVVPSGLDKQPYIPVDYDLGTLLELEEESEAPGGVVDDLYRCPPAEACRLFNTLAASHLTSQKVPLHEAVARERAATWAETNAREYQAFLVSLQPAIHQFLRQKRRDAKAAKEEAERLRREAAGERVSERVPKPSESLRHVNAYLRPPSPIRPIEGLPEGFTTSRVFMPVPKRDGWVFLVPLMLAVSCVSGQGFYAGHAPDCLCKEDGPITEGFLRNACTKAGVKEVQCLLPAQLLGMCRTRPLCKLVGTRDAYFA
jgi:hypothetical protein